MSDILFRDVTPDDASVLAHVLVTSIDHAFRGRVPDQCLEFPEAESAANWNKFFSQGLPANHVMLIAQTPTGEAIGYIWGGPNTKDSVHSAELIQISVLPAYHQHGIGRRLVCELAQRLAGQGLYSMRVEVLRVNPNRTFYERIGATYISKHPYDWEGVTLSMCVYGWADTRVFLTEQCG